jgi:hypothetical protein
MSDIERHNKVTALVRTNGAERASVLCANCSAVLMSAHVLPPGDHKLKCPVCGVESRVEVAGSTLMSLAAAASSIVEDLRAAHDARLARAEKKRRELIENIEAGVVGDPVTFTILGSHFLAQLLISVAISAAVSVGTALLTRLLTPAQKVQKGSLAGQELRLDRADYGIFIPEIYGGPPETDARTWAAATAFADDDKMIPASPNGYYYRVVTPGTTGATMPTLPTAAGASVTDGSCVFYCAGRAGGGVKVGGIVIWAPLQPIVKHVSTSQGGGGGK